MKNIYAALYYFLWKVNDPFGEAVTCADSIFVFRKKMPTEVGSEGLEVNVGVQIALALSELQQKLFFQRFYHHSSFKLVLLNSLLHTIFSSNMNELKILIKIYILTKHKFPWSKSPPQYTFVAKGQISLNEEMSDFAY